MRGVQREILQREEASDARAAVARDLDEFRATLVRTLWTGDRHLLAPF